MNSIRPGWDLVRRTTPVVGVIYLVHRLVVAILEDCHLAFVVVEAAETMNFMGVLLRMAARKAIGEVFRNSIEMLLLQGTVAAGAMTAAASRVI
jgi:hypothetical protein